MVKWHYFQDVKRNEVEKFYEEAMEKHPDRIYKTATARLNNPNIIAINYREK